MNSKFKKIIFGLSTLALTIAIASCRNNDSTDSTSTNISEDTKQSIKIGCFPSTTQLPTILEDSLSNEYNVELVLFDGNNMPAEALSAKEIDAVIGNGDKWLDTFNKENNTNLLMVDPYYSHFSGLYSNKYETIDEFPENSKIAIANDPMNINNALKLLQNAGLITLVDTPGNGELYSKLDIDENPKNIELFEMDLTTIAKNLDDVDGVVTSAILIKEAGYDSSKYLALPNKEDLQKVGLIINADSKDEQWVKDAIAATHESKNTEKLKKELEGTAFLLSELDDKYDSLK